MHLRFVLVITIYYYCKVAAQDANGVEFNSIDNMIYDLSVSAPNSQHLETSYYELASGQPTVKGSINTYYTDTKSNLIVDYVADNAGYRASYKINKSLQPADALSFETRINMSGLKALAG